MSDQPPDLPVRDRPRNPLRRVSVIWLIPAAAVIIALAIAWRTYADQGPLLEITFENASGVKAGETELHYRDVTVGEVEDVSFAESLDSVVVSVRIDPEIAEYVDEEASFWVVQPEVTTRGVRGLGTVLSGVYIEGTWDQKPGGFAPRHEGLKSAPLLRNGQEGLRVTLQATAGASLTEDTPILYKGVEVGEIGAPKLSGGGAATVADAVIYAPYSELVTTATRFWDTSGFTFSLGPNGADIQFSSVATLISGGVTFETIVSGGEPVEDNATFEVFADESAARTSLFTQNDGPILNLSVIFNDNVSGLTTGAPVDLRGVTVGEVSNLTGIVNEERFGDSSVRLLATLAIRPNQLGLQGGSGREAALDFLAERVQEGLRARLASASLLTGGLKVEIVEVPAAEPAELDRDNEPFPLLPSTESDITDVSASAQGVLQRINDLPIEELLASAIGFLDSSTALVSSEEIRQVPEDVSGLLADVRGIVGSEEAQALPGEISGLVTELQSTTEELRTVVRQVEEQEGVTRLLAAVDAAGAAAENVRDGTEELPALMDSLNAVADQVEALPLDQLVGQLTSVAESADAIVSSEAAQALPDELRGLVGEITGATSDIREVVARIEAADGVSRVLGAIGAAGGAAQNLREASEDLPALVERLTSVATKADELPLDELVAELQGVVRSANLLVSAEDTQLLPADARSLVNEVKAATTDLRGVIDELQEQDAIERLLAAVDSAGTAAENLSEGTQSLPALMDRLNSVATGVDELPLDETIARLNALVDSANGIVGSEAAQALPADLQALVAQVESATGDLGGIIADLREAQAVTRLVAAVNAAGGTAQNLREATQDLPELVDRLNAVAGTAQSLPLEDLVSRVNAVVTSADRLLSSEAAQALPEEISGLVTEIDATSTELRGVVTDLRAAGAVDRLLSAVDSVSEAAQGVDSSVEGVPQLIERIDNVAAEAEDLPLEELVNRLSTLTDSANALIDSDSARALPASLNGALAETEAVLADLREAGVAESLDRTLTSAGEAAGQVETAAEQLPALIARIDGLLSQAGSTLDGYDADSALNRDARAALREVQSAADAVQSLARAIERRPNSLLLGR